MPKKVEKAKIVAVASEYLDPVDCESIISYKIIQGPSRLWGTVQLTDCSRKIEWFFTESNDESLAKADKAIKVLQQFRYKLAVALSARQAAKTRSKRK